MQLPVDSLREDIISATQQPSSCILLSAPTGSGKSTRVPLMLRDALRAEDGLILVIQPRRLAARMLAQFVAKQWPCRLGDEVGYAVRFDKRASAHTRVLFMTDGLLERRLTEDPELRGVSAIVFDEVHERRLAGDICLARALQLQASTRPELKLVVMSATLELDKLQDYLPHATVLRAEGTLYPVELSYSPAQARRDRWGAMALPPVWEQVADALKKLLESKADCGDVLVFLPGAFEIRRCEELLGQLAWMRGRDVFPLHGQLAPDKQFAAVEQGSRPRVILSTNIAETSLTIQGVRSVIDAGTARESRWDPARGLSTLHIVPISQAQAAQRAGRAGRLGPGYCVRLWGQAEQARRAPFPAPEVHRADLSAALLSLLAWGIVGFEGLCEFPWPDAPHAAELERAWQLLTDLGAINSEGGLSPIGQKMRTYPLPPVLARLLVAGAEAGCFAEMAAIAALLGGESLSLRSGLNPQLRHEGDFTDFQAEWRALQAAQDARFAPDACNRLGIMGRAARELAAAYRQLMPRGQEPDFESHAQSIQRALLQSMPTHLAVRNDKATYSARLGGKRSGKIDEHSLVLTRGQEGRLFIAAEMTEIGGRGVETKLARCTLIDECLITPQEQDTAIFDAQRKRVVNMRRRMWGDLMLAEKEEGQPNASTAAELLAEQVLRAKLVLKNWDGHVIQWINRLHCLEKAMPELEMPSFADEDRLVAITMLCEGATSFKEIEARPILPILAEWLSSWQRDCLNKYAPKTLKLSNGREVKLLYREDGTPSFGLKCQLLFGVRETPTVAEGRVTCLVEILAPNQRPYQVTSDLASFWARGYGQMKKDLAGRYPRHDWPEPSELNARP